MTTRDAYYTLQVYIGTHKDPKVKEAFNVLEETIQRMEELEQAQDLKIESLQCIETETKYQVAIRVLKEAFITLGKSDITDTCWFKFLEELEKENEELKKQNKIYLQRQNKLLDKLIICRQQIKVLLRGNQELKRKYESHDFLYQNEVSKNGALVGKIFEKDLKIQKLEKAIEIIKKKIRFSTYERLENQIVLFSNDFGIHIYTIYCENKEEYDLLEEVLGE